MRILQICSAREVGGGEKHLADLANALAQRGHDVFAALSPGSPVRSLLSSVAPPNIVELPMRNSLNLATAMKLSRLVRAQQIEIVHAHIARDYPLAALAIGRSKASLVLTRHVLFPLSRIHKLTLRRTARVIAVSRAVANSLYAQRIFDRQKIVTIHNGIDIAKFAGASSGTRSNRQPLRVGTIGHLAPIKGQEDFVRAAVFVNQRRNDVEFFIAGADKSPEQPNQKTLEKLISEERMASHIHIIGWVDDVAAFLSTLDIFVSSARSEPFGLSIVEAMAAGVPVIATASEGAREIIEDNQSGRIVPIADPASLAHSLTELLHDEAERRRLSLNGQTAAREHFCLERMVEQTEGVYLQARTA
ncbi:MAG TPA: glycosyltransferase family 4 protein [Pyrinomonadaceae bacterium]|nr:glycosyltransferase family 4 protein [Pyrinomonadaceae bacterium]